MLLKIFAGYELVMAERNSMEKAEGQILQRDFGALNEISLLRNHEDTCLSGVFMHSGFYKKGSEFRMKRIIQQVYIINEGS